MSKFASVLAALLLTMSATAYAADNNGGANNGQNGGAQNSDNSGATTNNGDNGGDNNGKNATTNGGKTSNDGAEKCQTGASATDPDCKNVQQ